MFMKEIKDKLLQPCVSGAARLATLADEAHVATLFADLFSVR